MRSVVLLLSLFCFLSSGYAAGVYEIQPFTIDLTVPDGYTLGEARTFMSATYLDIEMGIGDPIQLIDFNIDGDPETTFQQEGRNVSLSIGASCISLARNQLKEYSLVAYLLGFRDAGFLVQLVFSASDGSDVKVYLDYFYNEKKGKANLRRAKKKGVETRIARMFGGQSLDFSLVAPIPAGGSQSYHKYLVDDPEEKWKSKISFLRYVPSASLSYPGHSRASRIRRIFSRLHQLAETTKASGTLGGLPPIAGSIELLEKLVNLAEAASDPGAPVLREILERAKAGTLTPEYFEELHEQGIKIDEIILQVLQVEQDYDDLDE